MLLMLLLALPLGCIAALRPRSPADRGLLAASVIGLAIHPFVLGITLQQFFSTQLHVSDFGYCPLSSPSPLRPSRASSAESCGGLDRLGRATWRCRGSCSRFSSCRVYMRMIRVRLLETLGEPFVTTARAKGASETRVVAGHALRNAIGPVLPMLAVDAGTAITAAIYVETVFGLQGIGSLAVRAFSGESGGFDLPLTAGIVTVVGAFVVVLNVGADVAGAWLDPRIRTTTASGLIPLPRAVATRPRVRLGLNIAVGAALVALLALAMTHKDKGGGGHVRASGRRCRRSRRTGTTSQGSSRKAPAVSSTATSRRKSRRSSSARTAGG